MFKTLNTALLMALLTLPISAHAQSTDGSEETTDTEEAQAELPAVDDGLSLGEEAQPETYTRETNGDWDIQCIRLPGEEEEGDEPCQLFQALQDDQGTNVAEITLFRLPEGGKAIAGANILVPLETLLSAQLTMSIDNGKARRYPYSFCSPIGCFARLGFTAEDINAMKQGAVANITIVPAPAPDQEVVLPMSLSGFTASYESVAPVQQ